MSDEWRELDRRVGMLEKTQSAMQAQIDARHEQNLEKFTRLEGISTENGKKLDTLINRSNFLDGNADATGRMWKAVMAIFVAAIGSSGVIEFFRWVFTGKWN